MTFLALLLPFSASILGTEFGRIAFTTKRMGALRVYSTIDFLSNDQIDHFQNKNINEEKLPNSFLSLPTIIWLLAYHVIFLAAFNFSRIPNSSLSIVWKDNKDTAY